MSLNLITNNDLKLYLRALRTDDKMRAALLSLSLGPMAEAELMEILEQLEAVAPDFSKDALPLAEQLRALDEVHDGHLRAAHFYLRAVEALPDLDDARKAAVARIREGLLPSLEVVRLPYADQLAQASGLRGNLDGLRDELALFPTHEGDLGAWISAAFDAAAQMEALLVERTHAELAGARSSKEVDVRYVRGRALGVLGAVRASIPMELKRRPELARDVEEVLFRHLDRFAESRLLAQGAATAPPAPEE
jgi:hypothetical protein